jgi:hypothetical protein
MISPLAIWSKRLWRIHGKIGPHRPPLSFPVALPSFKVPTLGNLNSDILHFQVLREEMAGINNPLKSLKMPQERPSC